MLFVPRARGKIFDILTLFVIGPSLFILRCCSFVAFRLSALYYGSGSHHVVSILLLSPPTQLGHQFSLEILVGHEIFLI